MPVDFYKLKSFVTIFPEKVLMWNSFLTKTYFCKIPFTVLFLVTFAGCFHTGKAKKLQENNIYFRSEIYLKRSLTENNISKR